IAMKTEEFLEELSRQKAGMEPPERTEEEKRLWEEAVQKYEEEKRNNSLLDFDDLLLETLELLENGAKGKNFGTPSYILVDEFQDINPLQYRLIQVWNR